MRCIHILGKSVIFTYFSYSSEATGMNQREVSGQPTLEGIIESVRTISGYLIKKIKKRAYEYIRGNTKSQESSAATKYL
jgi:hypothetical protein